MFEVLLLLPVEVDREQFVLDADGQTEWAQINRRSALNLPELED